MQNYLLVMGVSGSGKTTIGKKLSVALALPFIEADDAHPLENIAKMQRGEPLIDEDRQPWLENLVGKMNEHIPSGFVVTCSALKKKYRNFFKENFQENLQIIYLDGDFELIKNRMINRTNHFMPASLLQTQFETLEPPQDAIVVNIDKSPDQIVLEIIDKISA